MKTLLIAIVMFLATEAQARYLDLDRFSLKLMQFTCNREMLTPDIPCDQYRGRIATDFDRLRPLVPEERILAQPDPR